MYYLGFNNLVSFTLATLVLAIIPGPDNLFVLLQSMSYGKKAGFYVVLGLCTGLLGHTLLVTIGVANFIQTNTYAFRIIKIFGFCYLLYLAVRSWTTPINKITHHVTMLSPIQLYRRGLLMNLTNPKVLLFVLALLPDFVNVKNGHITTQLATLGGDMIVITFIVFNMVAYLGSTISKLFLNNGQSQYYLTKITAIIFFLIAIKIIL
ncbi:MAG: LysE family translocator [Phycisphaerales bacterium]|nr:LysE family translocator [Phycisphaerales bacterium]